MTDLATAIRERDTGMQRAFDFSERRVPDWGATAYAYLRLYCLAHREFTSENVSDEAEAEGFPDARSKGWGSVYRRAEKEGVIRCAGLGRSLNRHNSVCPLWQSNIFNTF